MDLSSGGSNFFYESVILIAVAPAKTDYEAAGGEPARNSGADVVTGADDDAYRRVICHELKLCKPIRSSRIGID
jgi:hypothetical protein